VAGDAVQLRSEDGQTFVELNDDGDVNVKAPGDIKAEAGGTFSAKAATEIVLQAPKIRLKSPAIDMNGIAWATHVHDSATVPSGPAVP
jgi:hypothetical protein